MYRPICKSLTDSLMCTDFNVIHNIELLSYFYSKKALGSPNARTLNFSLVFKMAAACVLKVRTYSGVEGKVCNAVQSSVLVVDAQQVLDERVTRSRSSCRVGGFLRSNS